MMDLFVDVLVVSWLPVLMVVIGIHYFRKLRQRENAHERLLELPYTAQG